jgi:hypothetical protein
MDGAAPFLRGAVCAHMVDLRGALQPRRLVGA